MARLAGVILSSVPAPRTDRSLRSGWLVLQHPDLRLGQAASGSPRRGSSAAPTGVVGDPTFSPAAQAGPHAMAGPESSAHRPSLDPKSGATTAKDLRIFREKPDVVPHPDPAGKRHVAVGESRDARERLPLGQGKEVGDTLRRNPDHQGGAPPLAPARSQP